MASITKRDTRNGASFKITVCTGVDANGKQKRYFKTWKAPPGMNAKQAEKKAKQVAAEFEREIEYGYQADNTQTFSEYAQYVADQKKKAGLAPTTLNYYKIAIEKVSPYIGNIKVRDIRPQHINRMYDEITRPVIRPRFDYCIPNTVFLDSVHAMGISIYQFSEDCGICYKSAKALFAGEKVQYITAEKAADRIGKPLDELFAIEKRRTASAPSVRRIHCVVSEVLNYAEMEMIITVNPAKRVRLPKVATPERDYFQPEEVAAILAAADKEPIQWRAMVYMFALTGARRGEVCGMKWSNLDWEKKQIKIDSSVIYLPELGKVDGPTKTRNTRFVMLPDEVMSILRKLRLWQIEQRLLWGDQWEDTDYLFTLEKGGVVNPNNVQRLFSRFSEKYSLPHIHAHAFRHTAASIMISSGIDVVTVSKMLGHSTPATTENIYAHGIEEARQNAAGCISGAILGKKQA